MSDKENILLISANQLKDPYPVYPIGLSYLSTYFNAMNGSHALRLYDMNSNGVAGLVEALKETAPRFVGISLRNIDDTNSFTFRSFIDEYIRIVASVREHSRATVIVGGSGFSIFPKDLFEYLAPDFGIIGEGEESFSLLITALTTGAPVEQIDGLVYRNNSSIHVNERAGHTEQLVLEFDKDLVGYYWQKSGMLNIQTKRGCPFSCIYCSYPLIDGVKVRTLDPDNIVASLAKLQHEHGIDYVFFTDSVFNIANEYNRVLAQKLIDSKLGISWGAYFTLHNLTEDMLALYKKAGLTHVEFGTESISDTQLKNYGKHFTVRDVLEKSALCAKLKVNYAHFIILGGYGETEATLAETFANSILIENSVFFAHVGMRIYPGTRLAQLAIAEGVIDKNDDLLMPKYYIAKGIDTSILKEQATATGKRWIFPDADMNKIISTMRDKGWKGPLWEYARL